MGLVFNDTTDYEGLVQEYEREIGADYGDVSGSTRRLKAFTVSANLALSRYWRRALKADGTWKLDDTNHGKAPEIKTDLNSGQRTYTFLEDEDGNAILQYDRVWIADANGIYHPIDPVDPDTQNGLQQFSDGRNQSGMPTCYDKRGNEIILDLIPNWSYTNGFKASIKREASFFQYTDTNKKPGVPGNHHAFFFLVPAEDYARRHGLKSLPDIQAAIKEIEEDIDSHFSKRVSDERPPRLKAKRQNNR